MSLTTLLNGDLASGSGHNSDKTIKIWNPEDGTLNNTKYIWVLKTLSHGYLASASYIEIKILNP